MHVLKIIVSLACLPMLSSCAHLFVTSRKIDIEITGGSEKIEMGVYLVEKHDSDTTSYDFDKKSRGFLNQPLTEEPVELKRLDQSKKIEFLPLVQTYSVSSDERLLIFIKPYIAQQDIIVNVNVDGKPTKRYTLKPNSLGLYLQY